MCDELYDLMNKTLAKTCLLHNSHYLLKGHACFTTLGYLPEQPFFNVLMEGFCASEFGSQPGYGYDLNGDAHKYDELPGLSYVYHEGSPNKLDNQGILKSNVRDLEVGQLSILYQSKLFNYGIEHVLRTYIRSATNLPGQCMNLEMKFKYGFGEYVLVLLIPPASKERMVSNK